MDAQRVETRAADTLLERGVRIPVVDAPLLWRWLGVKEQCITLHQSTIAELWRVSRILVQMGLEPSQLDGLSLLSMHRLVYEHSYEALCILSIASRGKRWFRSRRRHVQWLSDHLTMPALCDALTVYFTANGVSDFTNTIRYMLQNNYLSPTEKGSQHPDGQSG